MGFIENVNKAASNEPNINIVADNINDVTKASDNMETIQKVKDNETNIDLVGDDLGNQYSYIEDNGDITEPVSGGTGTSKIATVADDLLSEDTIGIVAGSIDKVSTVSSNISKVTNVSDNMSKVIEVYDDLVLPYSNIEHAKENAEIAFNSAQTVTILEAQVDANTTAIANLATAQGSIAQDSSIVVDTTQKLIGISTVTPSTDTNVFEIDEVNDTITFKSNASVNFFANMVFTSSTPNSRNVSIKVINTADDVVLECFDMALTIPNGSTETISHAFLLTVGKNGTPEAPLTVRFEIVADDTGYTMDSFNSVITTSSSYDLTTEASGINYDNTNSGIAATNVQDALDEALNLDLGGIA